MSFFRRKHEKHAEGNVGGDPAIIEKGDSKDVDSQDASDDLEIHLKQDELKRGLKARHVTMIAIGGALGTGLIIGT